MTRTEDSRVGWTADTAWMEVDQRGEVRAINARFTDDFGWRSEAVVGRPLVNLVPESFRDAHNLGFARFVEFSRSNIIGQPVILPILTSSGETVMTETCIQAERHAGAWRFGALIARLEPAVGGR
jgi:PAS domain S-box-containing protein